MFGPANAFVSHAWRYRFLKDLVAAIKAWKKRQPRNSIVNLFLWVDIFVVNQHIDPPKIQNTEEEERNFKTFSDGLQVALQDVGRAIIVLSPWNRPEWMFRIWCLFEFYIMEMFHIQYEFVMPPEQESSFVHSLEEEGNTFLEMVSTLNMEHADSQSDYDKVQIKKLVVKNLGGFSKLNESTVGAVRSFCIQTCMNALSTMTEDKKANSNLLENSALLLKDVGDLNTAAQYFSEVIRHKVLRFGEGHVSVAATYCNMGIVYRKQGNLEKALEMYEKDLEITKKCLGDSHVSVADSLFNMSIIYDNLGDKVKGLELTRKAHSICVTALGHDHPKTKNYARFI